jgi:tetratricopeptide (TPR) repeat protein
MESPVQDTKKSDQNLAMERSIPNALVSANHLFKQGLALANQLDGIEPPDVSTFPPQASEDFLEEVEDLTAIQSLPDKTPELNPHQTYVQLESDQSWTQVWLQRGFIKLKQQNFRGASDNFQRVLQKDARSVEALNGLAVSQYHLENFQGAIASLRDAIMLRPTRSTLYCNLGTVLYGSQDFLGAVAAFQKGARLDPKDVLAYYGMGISLIQQQDYRKAIAAFRRAIILNDQYADGYYGLGYVHFRLGDLPAAIAAIGKAKQRNPKYAQRYESFLKHCLAQDG